MSTLKDKVSLQIENQLPDFVQSENPNFIAFMKAYYEFMESGELKLTSLGSVDSIIMEQQAPEATILNYILQEDTNLYRPDQKNTVLLQDTTNGAFVNGEVITGSTSKATATVRVEDINVGSRLFISAQNKFVIGETVTGGTSNATGVITDYTANPVQNIQQLMQYADVDDTIDQFFDEFKEAFLKTIPKKLASGVNERSLLKNIKDLYRAKGTRKGHELFFRILLNEDISLSYPTTDMLRVSDGNWSEDQILRVSPGDDTILMEDASDANGDIFILNEDGGQIKEELSAWGTSDLLGLVGQEITQRAVVDLSILAGGAYYGKGYSVINKATALVDSVTSFKYGGEDIYELVLSTDSSVGTFWVGHTITAVDNDNPDLTLYGKLVGIVTGYNLTDSTSSQYYDITDPLTVTAANGNDASVKIESLTSGDINSIIVDAGGSGYEIGDQVTVNNTSTNGTALTAEVSVVNGGIAPEAGCLVGEWGVELETATSGAPGDIQLETATGTGLIKQEEAYDMAAIDHIILEPYTTYDEGASGQIIVQESGTGNGDITDVRVTKEGYGYTKTPLLTLPTTGSRTGGTIYAKGAGVGNIRDVTILDAGAHYTAPVTINAYTNFLVTDQSAAFTLDEVITGATSGATGVYKTTDAARNVIKLSNVVGTFVGGNDKSGETITGTDSGSTAVIDSYSSVSLTANHGTLGETSGRFLNEDGFLDERTKKIQDSYYYQDYSYVVKSSTSINTWRDQLLASVHPAGWAVFGQVDIATAVQSIANITSIVGLGPLFKVIYTMLLGRRLGTVDQLPLNPFPAVGIHDPADAGNAFRISGSSATWTVGETFTGGTSGATGTVMSDTTNDHGLNILKYAPNNTVLFASGETITGSLSTTATIVAIYGLQGARDVTVYRYYKIIKPPVYMTGDKYGFHPNLGDANEWKFADSMVESAASARTFGSIAVYPVYLHALTTISSGINASVTTIPVAELANLPTQGTIKLGTEEITYTGKSAASGAGNLTGGTRGANGTTAASHLSGVNLTLVRLAASQNTVSGFRLSDWAEDWRGVAITIGDMATYANRKNNISAPSEITLWKT